MNPRFLAGIDEVGRGPVAGPVYVCAFLAEASEIEEIVAGAKLPLRDSKKLTAKMREKWFAYLQKLASEKTIRYIMTKASNKEIDDKGIAVCIRACVDNCLEKLNFDPKVTKVYLDGGLKTLEKYNQETVIKGDENIPVVALASIIAKVSRVKEMDTLAKIHDKYSWDKNKGYGTKAHMDAIDEFGTCPFHRITFLQKHTHAK
jgi:ribonuclease HII